MSDEAKNVEPTVGLSAREGRVGDRWRFRKGFCMCLAHPKEAEFDVVGVGENGYRLGMRCHCGVPFVLAPNLDYVAVLVRGPSPAPTPVATPMLDVNRGHTFGFEYGPGIANLAVKPVEPWRPRIDDWDLLPDVGEYGTRRP